MRCYVKKSFLLLVATAMLYNFTFVTVDAAEVSSQLTEVRETKQAYIYQENSTALSELHGKLIADTVEIKKVEDGYEVDVTFLKGQYLQGFALEGDAKVVEKQIDGDSTTKVFTLSVDDLSDIYNATITFADGTSQSVQMQFDGKQNPFSDIQGLDNYSKIVSLFSRGIFKESDQFHPNSPTTRYQFALMLYRALDIDVDLSQAKDFKDLNNLDAETVEAIKALNAYGVINGVSEDRFSPHDTITRSQAARMIYRVLDKLGYEASADANMPFRDIPNADEELLKATVALNKLGIMTGYQGKFSPNAPLTRDQMSKVLYNSLEVEEVAAVTVSGTSTSSTSDQDSETKSTETDSRGTQSVVIPIVIPSTSNQDTVTESTYIDRTDSQDTVTESTDSDSTDSQFTVTESTYSDSIIIEKKSTSDEDKKSILSFINSTTAPSTFLFTGGNLTIASEGSGGYRNYIQHVEERIRWEMAPIKQAIRRQNFVFNTQNKGMTASQMLTEFNERVAQFKPKTVFVNLGYDDAQNKTDIDKFKADLKLIINKILGIGAVPILESPIYPKDQSNADQIANYVDAMNEIASANQVLFINHFDTWKSYNDSDRASITTTDGITPNELGHLRLSKEVMRFLGIGEAGATWRLNNFNSTKETYKFNTKLSNVNYSKLDPKLAELIQGNKPITWLFTGDSITHGALSTKGYQSFAELFGERVKVGMSAVNRARENDIVLNTGVANTTTKDLMENFDRWVTWNKPDVVFIAFGMNDCYNYLVPLDEYRKNLEVAVDKVKDLGAIPILQTQNTVRNDANGRIVTLPQYVQVVREVAAEKKVLLIDHYEYWSNAGQKDKNISSKWLNDSVHPNNIGTARMAVHIFETLGL